jgi:transcriptional regulator with XRE-family HTH domain
MSEFHDQLRKEFADPEYRVAYADSFVDAWIGLQIRAIREQREMTQKQLADMLHTTQTAISRLESANYSGRSISTLKEVAKALDCRLKVSFETYGSLIEDADKLCIEFLRRPTFAVELSAPGSMPPDIRGYRQEENKQESSVAEMPLKHHPDSVENSAKRLLVGQQPKRCEAA